MIRAMSLSAFFAGVIMCFGGGAGFGVTLATRILLEFDPHPFFPLADWSTVAAFGVAWICGGVAALLAWVALKATGKQVEDRTEAIPSNPIPTQES